jgi:hypothetical protein
MEIIDNKDTQTARKYTQLKAGFLGVKTLRIF